MQGGVSLHRHPPEVRKANHHDHWPSGTMDQTWPISLSFCRPALLVLRTRPFVRTTDPSEGPSRWISFTWSRLTMMDRCTRTKVAGSSLRHSSVMVSRNMKVRSLTWRLL